MPSEVWLIYFEDADMKPEVFIGNGAKESARARFRQLAGNCDCSLFQRVEWMSKRVR